MSLRCNNIVAALHGCSAGFRRPNGARLSNAAGLFRHEPCGEHAGWQTLGGHRIGDPGRRVKVSPVSSALAELHRNPPAITLRSKGSTREVSLRETTGAAGRRHRLARGVARGGPKVAGARPLRRVAGQPRLADASADDALSTGISMRMH
jgi:hypothetical protein